MLYIITNQAYDDKDVVWHIGEKIAPIPSELIYSVQADGDELDWIKSNFNNLPQHKSKHVQTWHGDLARFIVACLP